MIQRVYSYLILFFICAPAVFAQEKSTLAFDTSYGLEIPGLVAIHSSPFHLYALSQSEGLVIFRAYSDSLAWLTTVENLQRRGNKLSSDAYFGYLYGLDRRLTILDPSSLLGVYSSTELPAMAKSVARIDTTLYVVLQNGSVGTLSLASPSTVDESFKIITFEDMPRRAQQMIASTDTALFFVGQSNDVVIVDKFHQAKNISLSSRIIGMYPVDSLLLAQSESFEIGTVNVSDSSFTPIGRINERLETLASWNGTYLAQTKSGQIYFYQDEQFKRFPVVSELGNVLAVNKSNAWVQQLTSVHRLVWGKPTPISDSNLAEVNDKNLSQSKEITRFSFIDQPKIISTYPRPLLIHLETTPKLKDDALSLSVLSGLSGIKTFQRNLYWQPNADNIGKHLIKVIGTLSNGFADSTILEVDVRPFNRPPRFTPIQEKTIPFEEPYEFTVQATDPDGNNPNLVRYVGLDMPTGATLDEESGVFRWTPSLQQVGKHQFRVIASDQYGTAASTDVVIQVLEIRRPGNE